MLKYRDISKIDYVFLHKLLEERDESVNISHRSLPSWSDHCAYWDNSRMIMNVAKVVLLGRTKIGYYYITKKNEIGIFIKKDHQGKGYGKSTIKYIMDLYPGVVFLANVNPKNKISQKMFKSLGFKHIQNTYRLG